MVDLIRDEKDLIVAAEDLGLLELNGLLICSLRAAWAERDALLQPPEIAAWQKLVELASQTEDALSLINQITGHYVATRRRVEVAEEDARKLRLALELINQDARRQLAKALGRDPAQAAR